MTKSEAVALFDNSVSALAKALRITPSAVYQWDEELPQDRADRVIGAALRTGRIPPPQPAANGLATHDPREAA